MQINDLKHFLLSIPLMQYWGWQDNQSFNGPSWSLSTEILAYLVFFLAIPALIELFVLMSRGRDALRDPVPWLLAGTVSDDGDVSGDLGCGILPLT